MNEITDKDHIIFNPFKDEIAEFFFKSEQIEEFLIILKEFLSKSNACGAIVGREGLGKTRLLDIFIKNHLSNVECIFLNGKELEGENLEKYLAETLKITYEVNSFSEFLDSLKKKNKRLFLIFDDAELLSNENLKFIENLCKNLHGEFSILLVGDEKLEKKLNSLDFKDLRTNMKFFLKLEPLPLSETEKFIKTFFLKVEKRDIKIDKDAVELLFRYSGGNIAQLLYYLKEIVKELSETGENKINKKMVVKILKREGINVKLGFFPKILLISIFILLIIVGAYIFFVIYEPGQNQNISQKQQEEKTPVKIKKANVPEKTEESKKVTKKVEQKPEINKETIEQEIEKQKQEQEKLMKESKDLEIPPLQEKPQEENNKIGKKEISEIEKQEAEKIEKPIKQTEQKETPPPETKEIVSKLQEKTENVENIVNPELINKKYFTTAKILSLRTGAGKEYPAIKKLKKYTLVITQGEEKDDWVKVKAIIKKNQYGGWVSKQYIKPLPKGIGIVNAEFLSLRAGPGTKYPIIVKIPYGEKVKILGEEKGIWIKVQYEKDGQVYEGWVSKYFLTY